MSELPEYRLDRIFDAPRESVWRAWTDPNFCMAGMAPASKRSSTNLT